MENTCEPGALLTKLDEIYTSDPNPDGMLGVGGMNEITFKALTKEEFMENNAVKGCHILFASADSHIDIELNFKID